MSTNNSLFNWDPSQGDFDRSQVEKDHLELRRKMNRDRLFRISSVIFSVVLITVLIIYFA